MPEFDEISIALDEEIKTTLDDILTMAWSGVNPIIELEELTSKVLTLSNHREMWLAVV